MTKQELGELIVLLSTTLEKLKQMERELPLPPDVEAARQQQYISSGNTGDYDA